MNKNQPTKPWRDEAIALYNSGLSERAIARQLGHNNHNRVKSVVAKYGTPRGEKRSTVTMDKVAKGIRHGEYKSINCRLPEGDFDRVAALAHSRGVTMAGVLRQMVKRQLEAVGA